MPGRLRVLSKPANPSAHRTALRHRGYRPEQTSRMFRFVDSLRKRGPRSHPRLYQLQAWILPSSRAVSPCLQKSNNLPVWSLSYRTRNASRTQISSSSNAESAKDPSISYLSDLLRCVLRMATPYTTDADSRFTDASHPSVGCGLSLLFHTLD